MTLSEDLESLWRQMANEYTENPAGVHLSPEACQSILGRLWEMYHASLYLESLIPPPPVTPQGENVVDFIKVREAKRSV